MTAGGRAPVALLALGVASLLASWNPASAPLGLLVGCAAALLCLGARRRHGGLSPVLGAALAAAVAGIGVSVAVLGLLAGVGRDPEGPPIVEPVPLSERKAQLDRAGERTQSAREAARRELDQLGKGR